MSTATAEFVRLVYCLTTLGTEIRGLFLCFFLSLCFLNEIIKLDFRSVHLSEQLINHKFESIIGFKSAVTFSTETPFLICSHLASQFPLTQ